MFSNKYVTVTAYVKYYFSNIATDDIFNRKSPIICNISTQNQNPIISFKIHITLRNKSMFE